GRLLACLAEAHYDDRGLRLPVAVAPYELYLVRLSRNDPALEEQSDEVYRELQAAGIEVLYDDRDVSPGVKFADADLLGIPLRATISARSLKSGGVELKRRDQDETRVIPLGEAAATIRGAIAHLHVEAETRIVNTAYPAA
ncbi:MAG TPA: His/Gly/Thr/Pro-type tRNA ligase C-terminal domain-containing protein, partial [Ardenticatenaceae bacterium]|nr:His/Gly/Thr/Pro-type tRNA ligase C-terminal domain-containing protein [Ardenticatenaceae bacterium]